MIGAPRVVEIDLDEEVRNNLPNEETKRTDRFSTISENLQGNQHKLADSPTIKNSLTDWIATFKNLPRYPANISEFITSGSLYFIMEEVDPEYFTE